MADAANLTRMQQLYVDKVRAQMIEQFGYKNIMQVPKIDKIVINMGVGEATQDKKKVDKAAEEMALIAGQKPVITKARKSIEECFALKPQGALEAEASILFGDLCMAEGSPAKAKEKYAGVAVLIEDARLKPLAISRLIVALETLKDETNAAKYRKELAEKFPNWHDDGL